MELWGRGLKWCRKLQATHLHMHICMSCHAFFLHCLWDKMYKVRISKNLHGDIWFCNVQQLVAMSLTNNPTEALFIRCSLSWKKHVIDVIGYRHRVKFGTFQWLCLRHIWCFRQPEQTIASAAGGTKTTFWVETILLHLGQCTARCVRLPSFWRRAKACEQNRYKWVASHA